MATVATTSERWQQRVRNTMAAIRRSLQARHAAQWSSGGHTKAVLPKQNGNGPAVAAIEETQRNALAMASTWTKATMFDKNNDG